MRPNDRSITGTKCDNIAVWIFYVKILHFVIPGFHLVHDPNFVVFAMFIDRIDIIYKNI